MKKQRSNALWQLLVLVALAAAVALTLAWPQLPFARREAEPVEVSVILRSTDGSDWANARLGMEQAAGQLRAEVRIVTLSAENDAAEQARLMGYEAQRGADVLVVIPAGELPAEPGAPVITLESAGGAASVCPDNEALGRALAGTDAAAVLLFEPAATEAAAAAKEKLGLAPALYGVGSTGPIAAALERGSLAASAVWSDFAAGYLAVEGAVRTARGEDWQPQPLAFSILRGEDIYEPDNQKLLFPVAS